MSEEMKYLIHVDAGRLNLKIKRDEETIYMGEITLIGDEEKKITEILKGKNYKTDSAYDMTKKLREIAEIMAVKDSKIRYWQGILAGINLVTGKEIIFE